MFCKNCGNQIPDNSAHCPNCGAAQGTAPQQAAPMNATGAPVQATPMNAAPAPAPAPKASSSFDPNFNKSVNVGGKKLEFSLGNLIPVAMIVLLLIAMIGIHSFTFLKVRPKGESKKNAAKYTYDEVIDDADDSKVFDNGFTSFMKFFEVFTEVVAIAGVAGCIIFMNKDNKMATRSLAVSGAGMFLGYFFLFIYGLYLKGEFNDLSKSVTYRGGPTATIIIWMILTLLITAGGFVAPMLLDNNKKSSAPAPQAPAGGFGGFNG